MNNTNSIPKNIYLGAGELEKLPELLSQHGHKVLLIHGHRPVEDGLLAKVRVLLSKAGFEHADMGQILPNPKYKSVVRGIKTARENDCDIILALGGGSTLQCAKGIALGLGYKGDIWDFWSGKKKPKKSFPVASIMTNPGSDAELNDACTLVRKGKQKTVHYPQLECSFAILDPELSQYPKYPTMNQVFSIFEHIYSTVLEKESTMDQAADLTKQLFDCAEKLAQNIGDIEARTQLYSIGLKAHTELPKVHNPYENLVDDFSFACSMPQGSAASALFISWCRHLELPQKKILIEFSEKVFDLSSPDFDSALQAFIPVIQKLGLPLSIEEAGLEISPKTIKSVAGSKLSRKVLKDALTSTFQ